MLNFPAFPETVTARQLECICCRELFIVSEDFASRTRQRTNFWRLVPDRFYDILLRYQPNRSLRTVTPHMRAAPGLDPNQFLNWSQSQQSLINCPRCGTDNRNWLALQKFPKDWWLDPLFLTGMVLTIALTAGVFPSVWESVSLRWTIIMMLAVFLTGFIPLNSSTRHWRLLRDHEYMRPIAKHKSNWQRLPPPLRTGLITTGVFMFVVPFILAVLIPGGFDAVLKFVADEPEQPLILQIDDLLKTLTLLPDQTAEETQTAVQNVTDSLEILLAEAGVSVTRLNTLTPDQELTIILNMLRRMARNVPEEEALAINAIINALVQYAAVANLEINSSNLPDWFPVPISFLRNWLLYVLANSIVGISFGWLAAAGFARFTKRHLPRPIYHSITGMTRVVVWEAKKTLEIRNDIDHIQWMIATRNDKGGIDLVGLHRGNPDFQNGTPMDTKVLAQKYTLSSDIWCRITAVTIKDMRVPLAVNSPSYAIDRNSWPSRSISPRNDQSFSSGSSDEGLSNMNEPFRYDIPRTPPRRDPSFRQRSTRSASRSTPSTIPSVTTQTTVISPPPQPTTMSQATESNQYQQERRTFVSQPVSLTLANFRLLRYRICEHFNEGDLRTLCFDLGVEYDQLEGIGTENKARELISYCKRRGLISSLINECKKARPNAIWPNTIE